jgi:hypothetical protein
MARLRARSHAVKARSRGRRPPFIFQNLPQRVQDRCDIFFFDSGDNEFGGFRRSGARVPMKFTLLAGDL